MLTPIQELILRCFVLEPEDKTAFKRHQACVRTTRHRVGNQDQIRARQKELWKLNREKNLVYQREWASQNREKLRAQSRAAYWGNLEKSRAQSRATARRNWHTRKPKQVAYIRERYSSDAGFRFATLVRTRIRRALAASRSYKNNTTVSLVGCSFSELRAYLEKMFRPGMTWENHGKVWHIDHIRPCASFDLTNPVQQRECFNWKNLQPLFAEENHKKGAKYAAC